MVRLNLLAGILGGPLFSLRVSLAMSWFSFLHHTPFLTTIILRMLRLIVVFKALFTTIGAMGVLPLSTLSRKRTLSLKFPPLYKVFGVLFAEIVRHFISRNPKNVIGFRHVLIVFLRLFASVTASVFKACSTTLIYGFVI